MELAGKCLPQMLYSLLPAVHTPEAGAERTRVDGRGKNAQKLSREHGHDQGPETSHLDNQMPAKSDATQFSQVTQFETPTIWWNFASQFASIEA